MAYLTPSFRKQLQHLAGYTKTFLFSAFLSSQVIQRTEGIISDKLCGTLYSEAMFDGYALTLGDADQSVNTKKDYRAVKKGWRDTESARAEAGCKMTLCSEPYFQGACRIVVGQAKYPLGGMVRSANCTCKTECHCKEIFLPKHEYGRAYLNGGCNTCEAEYIDFINDEYIWSFPREYNRSVTALKMRKGCSLSIFSQDGGQGLRADIPMEVVEGIIMSYKVTCNDEKFKPLKVELKNASYPPMIDLPEEHSEFLTLFSSNETGLDVSHHPGMLIAKQSSQKRRHFRNVYLLLISDVGFFNSFLVSMFPNIEVREFMRNSTTGISERRIPISLDDWGISNVQLCIIDVPLLDKENDDVETYYRMLASLDEYLSTHPELKGNVPNGVLVMHEMHDRNITDNSSPFDRKLLALRTFKSRLVDENYSNVIFLLENSDYLTPAEQRDPSSIMDRFEQVIKQELLNFPMPIHTAILSYCLFEPKVNGQCRLLSGEYTPRNVHKLLKEICEKTGDDLGLAVFKSIFNRENNEILITNVTDVTTEMVAESDSKVDMYRLLSNVHNATGSRNASATTHVHHHHYHRYRQYSSISFVNFQSQSQVYHGGYNNRPDIKLKLKIKTENINQNNFVFKNSIKNENWNYGQSSTGLGAYQQQSSIGFGAYQQQQQSNIGFGAYQQQQQSNSMWTGNSNSQQPYTPYNNAIRNTKLNEPTSQLKSETNEQMGWKVPKSTGSSQTQTIKKSSSSSVKKTKVKITTKFKIGRRG